MVMLKERGNITVMMVLMIPFFVLMVALVVGAGRLFFTQERLQIAADRAATVGAASLAFDLNRIAKLNWELAEEFRKLRRNFEENSHEVSRGEQEIRCSSDAQYVLEEEMRHIAQESFLRANARAEKVFAANAPAATPFFPLSHSDIWLDCFQDPETGAFLRGRLTYDDVDGLVFDPQKKKEEAGGGELVQYCAKDPREHLMFAVAATQQVTAPLLTTFLGTATLDAQSLAQPYGGSMKQAASGGTPDDALYGVTSLPISHAEWRHE